MIDRLSLPRTAAARRTHEKFRDEPIIPTSETLKTNHITRSTTLKIMGSIGFVFPQKPLDRPLAVLIQHQSKINLPNPRNPRIMAVEYLPTYD
jgi:hypothetical protein